nr:anti-sigma factor [Kaistella montana]
MSKNIEVKNAVLETQETFEKLATEQAIEPPSHLKAEIFAKLDFTQSDVKLSAEESKTVSPKNEIFVEDKKTDFNKIWMMAASLLLLVSIGWNLFQMNSHQKNLDTFAKNNTDLEKKIENLENKNSMLLNAKKIQLEGVEKHPGMLAEVYWDNSKKVYLTINNLPKAPEGKQYQLWAIVDGKPVDAGIYDENNPEKMQEMKEISDAQAFAITLEKSGGSETPTMDEMYVMGKT